MKDLNSEELLFLGGDFNCTVNDKLDRNHLEPHIASQKALTQIIKRLIYVIYGGKYITKSDNILGHIVEIILFLWQDWIGFMCLIFKQILLENVK